MIQTRTSSKVDIFILCEVSLLTPHSGYIHCRFPERSIELKSLGKKLRELRSHYFGPHFVVAEHHQDHIASDVEIPTDTIAAMINDLSFSMDIIKISLSSKVARTTISLRLRQDEQALPISGFPRHLLTEERTECRLLLTLQDLVQHLLFSSASSPLKDQN